MLCCGCCWAPLTPRKARCCCPCCSPRRRPRGRLRCCRHRQAQAVPRGGQHVGWEPSLLHWWLLTVQGGGCPPPPRFICLPARCCWRCEGGCPRCGCSWHPRQQPLPCRPHRRNCWLPCAVASLALCCAQPLPLRQTPWRCGGCRRCWQRHCWRRWQRHRAVCNACKSLCTL